MVIYQDQEIPVDEDKFDIVGRGWHIMSAVGATYVPVISHCHIAIIILLITCLYM